MRHAVHQSWLVMHTYESCPPHPDNQSYCPSYLCILAALCVCYYIISWTGWLVLLYLSTENSSLEPTHSRNRTCQPHPINSRYADLLSPLLLTYILPLNFLSVVHGGFSTNSLLPTVALDLRATQAAFRDCACARLVRVIHCYESIAAATSQLLVLLCDKWW
jgi:hypothetical protein